MSVELAGLDTTLVGPHDAALVVVLLHGYEMRPEDLSPFARSIGVPALFVLPRGPLPARAGGYSWWDIDFEARNAALRNGPRDLAVEDPPGAPAARERISRFVHEVTDRFRPRQLVLGGFSQGGMLTLDCVLRGAVRPDALILLSTSRIAAIQWEQTRERLHGVPVLLSHGRDDADLAFSAGVALRDFLTTAQAQLTWVPFEGGHQIPLIVWRSMRKFLGALLT